MQIRVLNPDYETALTALATKNKRSSTKEANLAIENHIDVHGPQFLPAKQKTKKSK